MSELSSHAHEDAIFSLVPTNPRATEIAQHPDNRHLAWITERGKTALAIGPHIPTTSHGTLATLGRDRADIFVPGSDISRKHCSFELHSTSKAVMLYDTSSNQSTQFFGVDAVPFEDGRLRRVVLLDDVNTEFQMGFSEETSATFRVDWHKDPRNALIQRGRNANGLATQKLENPRQARTRGHTEEVAPSRLGTRLHTPGRTELPIRYRKITSIGTGSFGTVDKVINLDTGSLLAVKKIRNSSTSSGIKALKREIEHLSICTHEHIVEFISFQNWGQKTVEIFMGLKEGTLHSIIEGQNDFSYEQLIALTEVVFEQMVKALDFLSSKDIVHRDVKPQNILYTTAPGAKSGYRFQLGDFGLCNRAIDAASYVGSPPFMAPEVLEEHPTQTPKVDVWSLFVTLIWTLDVHNYRTNGFRPKQQNLAAILRAAEADEVRAIKEMARVNPDKRASAAQMILRNLNGDGLSTPRDQIQPLDGRARSVRASQASSDNFSVEYESEPEMDSRAPRSRSQYRVTKKRSRSGTSGHGARRREE